MERSRVWRSGGNQRNSFFDKKSFFPFPPIFAFTHPGYQHSSNGCKNTGINKYIKCAHFTETKEQNMNSVEAT